MGLSGTQIQDIELKADELLQAAYGSLDSVSIPVNMNSIVTESGVNVYEGRFPDPNIEGVLNRGKQAIYVNQDSIGTRKRFTTAHELGHYFLHDEMREEVFYRMDSMNLSANRRVEREANWFAASLLMPRKQVEQFWYLFRDIAKMAEKFQVSITAMRWRLKNLGLIE